MQSPPSLAPAAKGSRRSPRRRRFLPCPCHPEQALQGNGKKYYLHLLSPQELQQRGMPSRKARLLIQAYPVFVLSTEWLEQLYCRSCEQLRWCHVLKQPDGEHQVRWAPRDLWLQVAHVDPAVPNPTVSEYSRREARLRHRRRFSPELR